MAMAFETLALNSGKIGELNITPDLFSQFMKKGSKKISAKARVKNVQNFLKLTDQEIKETLEKNQDKLMLSEKQKERWHKKCLCLIEFDNLEEITPLDFDHQGNMDDWLIIEKIEDVVV